MLIHDISCTWYPCDCPWFVKEGLNLLVACRVKEKRGPRRDSTAWGTTQWLSEYLESIYLSQSSIHCLITFCLRDIDMVPLYTKPAKTTSKVWWIPVTTQSQANQLVWKERIFLYYFQIMISVDFVIQRLQPSTLWRWSLEHLSVSENNHFILYAHTHQALFLMFLNSFYCNFEVPFPIRSL